MTVRSLRPASPEVAGWELECQDSPAHVSVNAARYSTIDGCVGTQSISEIEPPGNGRSPLRVAGVHGPEPPGLLLSGPTWTPLGWTGEGLSWSLDLSSGTVVHRLTAGSSPLTTQRWAVAGQPGVQAYLAPISGRPEVSLATPSAITLAGDDGTTSVTVVADRRVGGHLFRVAATRTGRSATQLVGEATAVARRLVEADPATAMEQQRRSWADRWASAALAIEGDATAELRTRFAVFHLLALSDHGEELAIGARGLTGEAYGGHVFWDADTFVLPSLASLVPAAARAMIEYRFRRLEQARKFARRSGHQGARFPWESAASGADVTPRWGTTPHGNRVPIMTGQQEQHVGSDIAWSIRRYQRWTGDDSVIDAGGRELIVEVARYWASRIEVDAEGVGHLNGVIGPDEYHENVNDNAFTNRMAARTLRDASQLVGGRSRSHAAEAAQWSEMADAIELGYDTGRGRHEQFAGFDDLEPIMAASIAQPPFPADLLLGAERVSQSQLIKQADVLMMHHLIPDEMPAGSLQRDLAYYMPRTVHGSSLSPAIHAAVLARAGFPDDALHWYHIALAVDIDDLTQTASGGLHYANIGGAWAALLGGFLGVRPTVKGLVVGPNLPQRWRNVRVGFRYRGTSILVEADHRRTVVSSTDPIPFATPQGRPPTTTTRLELIRNGDGWSVS